MMSAEMLVTVRTAQPQDAAAMAELETACFSIPWTQRMLTDSMVQPNNVMLVADRGGEVVGWAGMTVAADEADVLRIAVAASARRQGIASALLDALLAECRRRGVTHLMLEVRAGNQPAISLYEAHGFVRDGIRPRYYDRPVEDAVLYHRPLDTL